MPGPGGKKNKSKSKAKPPAASSSSSRPEAEITSVYVPNIENAEGWNMVVNVLCKFFNLPDLATRSGLKKVHTNFNSIYNKMDRLYNQSLDNWKIRGGIVGIASKMCVDALLRNKLFEKGILDKIIPLLHNDETRHLALRSLSTITHHGGASARCEIARHGNTLTKLMRDLPDDEKVAELSVITLAHSVTAVVEGDSGPANPSVLKEIDMVDILKVVLETIKRPARDPRTMIDHAIGLVTMSSLNAPSAFKAYPSAVNFLAAGLRSKDWVTRCSCLGGLIRLYRKDSEEDQRMLDPTRFMAACQSRVPSHLNEILMTYGPTKSEMYLTLFCTNAFQKAMMQVMQDHNLYALGLKQSELILKTEFSIVDGAFEVQDPRTGQFRRDDNMGLPFLMWSDSLPHCAKAIRAKGKPEEQDAADILDIKYMIMKGRIGDALSHARKAIQRNPDQAYFHYAITLSADNVQGLRAAKKGLKCKLITPFVKYQMMQRAVEHAGDMGVKLLQDSPEEGDKKWEEGIAFLMSALEDAKAYVDGAPPDNRHMKNVGYWYVLLTILIKENLSPDLRELDENIKKLQVADEFSRLFGVTPPKTNLRLAQQAAVKYYPPGVKEWSRVFAEFDNYKDSPSVPVNHEKLEDDLASWLEDMRLEDGTLSERMRCEASETPRKVNFERVTLYRCSWCGNPSAALRKCSGCAMTRYCDSACQKSHWTSHKKECTKSSN